MSDLFRTLAKGGKIVRTGELGQADQNTTTLNAIFAIKYMLLDKAREEAHAEAQQNGVQPALKAFSTVAREAEETARDMVSTLTEEQKQAVVAMFENWTLDIEDLLFAVTKLSR